jgi:hypothetical protein
MPALALTLDELMEIVRTCESIEIGECTPHYLQEFIAVRLQPKHPTLSGKVRQFAEDQMGLICEYIKRTFDLLR